MGRRLGHGGPRLTARLRMAPVREWCTPRRRRVKEGGKEAAPTPWNAPERMGALPRRTDPRSRPGGSPYRAKPGFAPAAPGSFAAVGGVSCAAICSRCAPLPSGGGFSIGSVPRGCETIGSNLPLLS
jgi:hypothetical protein